MPPGGTTQDEKVGELFVRPLRSERRLARASGIVDEDIGSQIQCIFRRAIHAAGRRPPRMRMTSLGVWPSWPQP